MLNQAIKKIKTEMDQANTSSYVQVVGKFLLNHLETNPGAAERVMVDGKTIAKSLDEMQKVARKKQSGGCAVLTDQEGFKVVMKYFGITTAAQSVPVEVPKTEPAKADFDIKLEDLM
jgi:hypothetical protein